VYKKYYFVFVILTIFLIYPKVVGAANYPAGNWDHIIENKTYNQTLILTGHSNDNTLIINSKFNSASGPGIRICGVNNVYILSNEIYNEPNTVGGHGIELGSSSGCGTENITIDNNIIHDIRSSGIIPKASPTNGTFHNNLVIKNNNIYNIGNNDKDHGIYNIAGDVKILNNVIHGSMGNGISTRSSGVISGNIFWDTVKSCIRYFTDHETGPSKKLLIENNICYNTPVNPIYAQSDGYPLISVLYSPDTLSDSWLADKYEIRFNTLVSTIANNPGIQIQSSQFNSKDVKVYGNLVINSKNQSNTIINQYIDYLSRNYVSSSLMGFMVNSVPYNFHLAQTSGAINFASGESSFPPLDRDGKSRSQNNLDSGAYQFTNSTSISPYPLPNFNIADLEPDGDVDVSDFNILISKFGLTGVAGWIRSDIIKNGIVNIFDFNKFISNY